MQELTSTLGLIALAAVVAASLALILVLVLLFRLRALRRAQRVVLGDRNRDVVGHVEGLQSAFEELRRRVEGAVDRIELRTDDLEHRLDGCLAYHSVLRYDAYGEMSGRQSATLALLDARSTGVVISSILHREQARIYVKPVIGGSTEHELSPEETQAIETALAAGAPERG